MAVIVYPKAQAVAVVEALTPMSDDVQGIGPCELAGPMESTDGRYMHDHPWSQLEMDWMEGRISGISGAMVLTEKPKDWVTKTDRELIKEEIVEEKPVLKDEKKEMNYEVVS